MPPRSSKPKATGAPQPTEQDAAELQELASRARTQGRVSHHVAPYLRSLAILVLLGIYSNLSQLALSPVYGGIPSSIHHAHLVMAGCFVGWSGNLALRHALQRFTTTPRLLPVVAAYVPLLQFLLFSLSGQLGAKLGPVVTEGLTLLPITALSAACVADELDGAQLLPGRLPSFLSDAAPGLGSWGVFVLAEHIAGAVLRQHVGKMLALTRVVMEAVVAGVYAVLAPSRYLVLAAPALLHTAMLNTHLMTPGATEMLGSALESQGWLMLERRESVTGYLSVVESMERGFRAMRCDHSLLGGQWTRIQGQKVAEPIYGVFAMLEAVRLVETGQQRVADEDSSALVIGLGIGTTPSALVTHGIDTTVVEIDPVVHEFAKRYFDLKENNAPAISDAVGYTAGLLEAQRTFDYIVHDVFTGGAEPIALFTLEFLQGLSDLLNPNGVIAINYAGDFSLPAPRMIVRTITTVFPTCRIFRESPAKADLQEGEADFTNMVIFCRKGSAGAPLTFRPAVPADFLGSRARQMFLQPRHELQQLDFLRGGGVGEGGQQGDGGVLRRNETDEMATWHRTTATGHWAIMRTVMPAKIWEMW